MVKAMEFWWRYTRFIFWIREGISFIRIHEPNDGKKASWQRAIMHSYHILARTTLIGMISINLTLTNYTYPYKHLFWTYDFVFVRKAYHFFLPLSLLVHTGSLPKGRRQKAMVGWSPQVVNWWTLYKYAVVERDYQTS